MLFGPRQGWNRAGALWPRRLRMAVVLIWMGVCGELLILAETTSGTQSCESLTYR